MLSYVASVGIGIKAQTNARPCLRDSTTPSQPISCVAFDKPSLEHICPMGQNLVLGECLLCFYIIFVKRFLPAPTLQ